MDESTAPTVATGACVVVPASFRDNAGFVFRHDDVLYRQVNDSYRADFDQFVESGLYDRLIERGWLIPHQEVEGPIADEQRVYRILRPEPVRFISYPYEWCFSQLKDAALLTLDIQRTALEFGMTLKDASAYNVQFHEGRPVLIDTLSFQRYKEGEPWAGYRQFCQHFLAPLALMSHRDIRLGQLSRVSIDGVALDLASNLLPKRTWLRPGMLMHLHLHALAQNRYANSVAEHEVTRRKVSKAGFMGLIDSLKGTIAALSWKPMGTEWANYYGETNYSAVASDSKARIVGEFLEKIGPRSVVDLGANTGQYSRLSSDRGITTLAFDIDPAAVERNYLSCASRKEKLLLPLLMDLTNPSPAMGWHHRERDALTSRVKVDAVLALALIHHLAIGNNVPLEDMAGFLSELGKWLIIEFVPKSDTQVQRLLVTREDIFPDYCREDFERSFGSHFAVHAAQPITESDRIIFLMEGKG